METETINWKDLQKDLKKREMQIKIENLKSKAMDVGKHLWEHKEAIAAGVVTGIGILAEGRRIYDRIDSKLESRRKQHEIYDPSMHKNIHLKRQLTSSQEKRIAELRSEGYSYHEIYRIMGIL